MPSSLRTSCRSISRTCVVAASGQGTMARHSGVKRRSMGARFVFLPQHACAASFRARRTRMKHTYGSAARPGARRATVSEGGAYGTMRHHAASCPVQARYVACRGGAGLGAEVGAELGAELGGAHLCRRHKRRHRPVRKSVDVFKVHLWPETPIIRRDLFLNTKFWIPRRVSHPAPSHCLGAKNTSQIVKFGAILISGSHMMFCDSLARSTRYEGYCTPHLVYYPISLTKQPYNSKRLCTVANVL